MRRMSLKSLALAAILGATGSLRAQDRPTLSFDDKTPQANAEEQGDDKAKTKVDPKAAAPHLPELAAANCCCSERLLDLAIGSRAWFSWGRTEWNFAGIGGVPNIQSELKWRDADSVVAEFNVDACLVNRWVAKVDVGIGGIDDGHLRDTDFAADDREGITSDVKLPTTGDTTFYVTADFGYRLIDRAASDNCRRGIVDVLVGYQYWREDYDSVGGVVRIFPPGDPIPPGAVITESFTRHCVRVGARTRLDVSPDLAVQARLMFMPWSHTRIVDYHFQRADFALPSGVGKANGGFGVAFDTTVSYRVWKNLFVEAGYQLFHQRDDSGTLQILPAAGTLPQQTINEVKSLRHGFTIGLMWHF
jgi:hypothetical protein